MLLGGEVCSHTVQGCLGRAMEQSWDLGWEESSASSYAVPGRKTWGGSTWAPIAPHLPPVSSKDSSCLRR